MANQGSKRDSERLLLDIYQEKLQYVMEERQLDNAWDWKTTLGKFNFRLPSEEGIPEKDLRQVFDNAEAALRRCPHLSETPINTLISINRLGKRVLKDTDVRDRDPIIEAATETAHALSAHPETDIIMQAVCGETENGELNTEFRIGSGSLGAKTLEAMIRANYGRVEYRSVTSKAEYPLKCYAVADTIDRSKQALERQAKEVSRESWVDVLLSSLACSRKFKAEFRFHPLLSEDEKNQLRQYMSELEEIYTILAFYSEVGWNNGITGGGSTTIKDAMLHTILKNMHVLRKIKKDGVQTSENYSFSYAKNSKTVNQHAVGLMSEIEYRLTKLRQIRNSVGWSISISVSAEDEATIDAITSIISGTAEKANFSLKWVQLPRVATIAAGQDILPFLMLPTKEFAGFEFVENENFSLVSPASKDSGMYIGNILWNGTKASRFFLPRQVLNRHAFICGMTGSGKTNTLFKIMEEINVPFLVIEPVKGEYRSLISKYPDTKIRTMRTSDAETENVEVLRLNPFWFPKGANLAFHIDSLKTIISSAFELSAAMPNIVEQCLYNVYLKSGWNIITNQNDYEDTLPEEYLYPTFSDLTNEVADYLEKSEFGEEVLGNYKGALLSRLKSFTNGAKGALMNNSKHLDYGTVMSGRSIIELEGLADDADKCLVMGTILVQYYQYVKIHFHDTDKRKNLKHIIVIEEAHRLFKNVKSQNKTSEGADPVGQLVENLSNIMAEIRAFGEGMLIVDQSPTKIAEDVIKNSGTKLVHRIDNEQDIKMLQSAMLMQKNTIGFSSLAQGEALIRTDNMLRPCKVKMLCSDIKESYSLAASFKTEGAINYEINDTFVANSIIQDEMIYAEIKNEINLLFSSFVWMMEEDWYDVINVFLNNIVGVLTNHRVFDRLQNRFNILVQIISAAVKKMYGTEGVKNAGLIHMFVMRTFSLFAEARNGMKVKTVAIQLMQSFFKERLCDRALYASRYEFIADKNYQRVASELNMDITSERFYTLYLYIYALTMKENDKEKLPESISVEEFFDNRTYLSGKKYKAIYYEMEMKLGHILVNIDIM